MAPTPAPVSEGDISIAKGQQLFDLTSGNRPKTYRDAEGVESTANVLIMRNHPDFTTGDVLKIVTRFEGGYFR
ncbi:MAG: hypothetical protein HKN33_16840 [Pyrinomonadaceae bacterium]|nr:hypothetical protein [Pyrinomonadaceae bacterium]